MHVLLDEYISRIEGSIREGDQFGLYEDLKGMGMEAKGEEVVFFAVHQGRGI